MTQSKSRMFALSLLAVISMGLQPARVYAQDSSAATGILGGMLALLFGTEYLTQSKIDVTVDVYPTTATLPHVPQMLQATKSGSFSIPLSSAQLAQIYSSIVVANQEYEELENYLKNAMAVDEKMTPTLKLKVEQVLTFIETAHIYRWAYVDCMKDGFMSAEDISRLSDQGRVFLVLLAEVNHVEDFIRIQQEITALDRVAAANEEEVKQLARSEGVNLRDQAKWTTLIQEIEIATERMQPSGTAPNPSSVAGVDAATFQKIIQEPKVREAAANSRNAKRVFDQSAKLLGELNKKFGIFQAADAQISKTFSGLTSGGNFGPIANEGIQEIFSSNLIHQAVSNEKNWKRVNFARSKARTGNQGNVGGPNANENVIVYLENMLTPVLKRASFDPTEFIAANGNIYRTIVSSAASIYGMPLAAAGGSPVAGINAAVSPYNLARLDADAANAEAGAKQHRVKRLNAMKEIIDLQTGLGVTTPGSLELHVEKSKAVLQKLATRLDEPATPVAPYLPYPPLAPTSPPVTPTPPPTDTNHAAPPVSMPSANSNGRTSAYEP